MPTNALSIIDPRRPELNTLDNMSRGTYTFRPRFRSVEFSLGWELEANHRAKRVPSGVSLHSDGSVNGDAMEYVVMPTVVKSPRYVLGLLKELVHSPELNTDDSCGFHVHMSPRHTSDKAMKKWALMCQILASEIEEDAFNAVPDSRKNNQYCKSISLMHNGQKFSASKYNNPSRYHWLNIVEMFRPSGIRTVEMRLLGHTHRWKYLLAWSLFTLMLGREAWELMQTPLYESKKIGAVDRLKGILTRIKEDVKPLSKRSEPMPDWVYSGLSNMGIDFTKWERPLAKIRDAESEALGRVKVYYSDAQATIEPRESNGSECECGCGEEGRCYAQMHSDGDCDSSYCGECHSEGNCNGPRRCDECQSACHSDGEDCTRPSCAPCTWEFRSETLVSTSGTVEPRQGVTSGTPHIMSVSEYSALVHPALYAELNALHTARIENINLTATNAMLYGEGMAQVIYEPLPVGELFDAPLATAQGLDIMTGEELEATVLRERELYHANRIPLSVAEVERMNQNNTDRLNGGR